MVRTLSTPLERAAKPPSTGVRSRRLQAVVATQLDLMQSDISFDAAVAIAAERARALAGATGGALELLEGEELVYRATAGALNVAKGKRFPMAGSFAGRSMQQGQPLICEDAESDPRVNLQVQRCLNVRSMIVCPIQHQGRVVGVLKVTSEEPEQFDADDEEIVALIAAAVGAVMVRISDEDERMRLVREREDALKRLEETHAVLRAFYDHSPMLMGTLELDDNQLRFGSANRATHEIIGCSDGTLEGALASAHCPSEALVTVQAEVLRAHATGAAVQFNCWRGEGRSRRHLTGTISPLPKLDGERPRFCYALVDTTEEAELRKRIDLTERMATVGRLAAGVAHEANNPLAYVISNLAFATDELRAQRGNLAPDVQAELEEVLAEAQEGASRVKAIVRDLHTFSRASQEERVPVELERTIRRSVAMARYSIKDQARVELELAAGLQVLGNEARLGQVILNLVINAAQAMPRERPAAQNEIRIRTAPGAEGKIRVEVTDNGAGIPVEVLPRIFDPFFTTKRVGEGTGLGLSICHNIVREHGGELKVESTPGQGTTFELLLPS